MTSVAEMVGATRIVRAGRIPHVLGDPNRSPERERQWRYDLVKYALSTLAQPVTGPVVFEAEDLVTA